MLKTFRSLAEFNQKYNEPFKSDTNDGANNMILSQNYRLSLSAKALTNKLSKSINTNTLVLGLPGTGKTYSIAESNIVQINCSKVITDFNGQYYKKYKELYKENGFKVKYLSINNINETNHYNPLSYIKSDEDILGLVKAFIKITNKEKEYQDPFWERNEESFLTAVIGYLYHFSPEQLNFAKVFNLVQSVGISEENKSELDILMKEAEEKSPDNVAVRSYKLIKMCPWKTRKAVFVSTLIKLHTFSLPKISEITKTDDIELDKIGAEKTVLFIEMNPMNNFSNVAALLYEQLSQTLKKQNKRDVHIRFIFDEFPNIGYFPNIINNLKMCSIDNTSYTLIMQNINQLKDIYKDDAEAIIESCNIVINMGIDSVSDTNSLMNIFSTKHNGLTEEDVTKFTNICKELKNEQCLIIIKSLGRYIIDTKYNTKQHLNYKPN